MKNRIAEINISYKQFVDADDHARFGDMCKEIGSIRESAYKLIEDCNKYLNDLNLHR